MASSTSNTITMQYCKKPPYNTAQSGSPKPDARVDPHQHGTAIKPYQEMQYTQ